MKRGNKLLILMGVLLAVTVGVLLTKKLVSDSGVKAPTEQIAVFSAETDAITSIRWEYDGESNAFVKQDGLWVYQDDPAFPLDEQYLVTMLSNLRSLSAVKCIEEPGDLGQYGLTAPWCAITVAADGKEYPIAFGDENSIGGKRYLSNGDGRVYLISTSLSSNFTYHLLDLAQIETIPAISQIDSLTVSGGAEVITVKRQEAGGEDAEQWLLEKDGTYTAADTQAVEELTGAITGTVFNRCKDYKADSTVLLENGLGENGIVITVAYTADSQTDAGESSSFVLELSKDGQFGRLGGSSRFYTVDASIVSNFLDLTFEDLLPTEE